MQIVFFNMVWGFPLEYIHGILLGVVKYLFEIWMNGKSNWHFTAEQHRQLNEIITKILPTQEIHFLSRSFSDKAKWKASEWLSWLLYKHGLPCLQYILPDTKSRTDPKTGINVIEHVYLLVRSVFTLLGNTITELELEQCEYDILRFVGEYEMLYGISNKTFNVHTLLHLVHSVRMSGPLWATSAFPFEDGIFYLKKRVTGPKGIYNGIASTMLQRNSYKLLIQNVVQSKNSAKFCKSLFSRKQCVLSTERVATSDMDVVLL